MKDRIDATLAAIAEAQEALVRSEILLKNLQYLGDGDPVPRFHPMDPAAIPSDPYPSHSTALFPTDPVFRMPDPDLSDEPPSRPL